VQEFTSSACFQVRSLNVLEPNSSFSRFGVESFALVDTPAFAGSRFQKTFGRPTMTWKCFP
jgi:hypothetical protein